ncbi:hypothetical protein BC351_18380 [Paenibacillus ferrarius]|uniref:Uncharacterized protein n=1 Tax=Paenibacillus ferrarius TaxID=1469647 RepID=A0A1V4HQB7_9BACL|nr:hypothetical protein [Paenibacillus ferrarius]OPH60457.1 hypothetical protein BC351_18380 [Paenibacillus ferrarius]
MGDWFSGYLGQYKQKAVEVLTDVRDNPLKYLGYYYANLLIAAGPEIAFEGAVEGYAFYKALKGVSKVIDNGGLLDSANFAQKTYSARKFSDEGIKYYSDIAGRSVNNVEDLVGAIKNSEIQVSQVPIDYIVREGNTLILNTRSSQALEQAGIPRSQWNAINRTGDELFEKLLTDQLERNKLTSEGVPTVRPTGQK